jgi:hypothetical protein
LEDKRLDGGGRGGVTMRNVCKDVDAMKVQEESVHTRQMSWSGELALARG